MKKYFQIIKFTFLETIESRNRIISLVIMNIFGLLASYLIWERIMADNSSVAGYDLNKIIAYYILNSIFLNLFGKNLLDLFQKWVINGDFSMILVKPVKVFYYSFANEIGSVLGEMIIRVVLFSIPLIIFPSLRNQLNLTISSFFVSILYFTFSSYFLFTFYFCIGTLSFWVINLDGVRNITFSFIRLVQGKWFPFDMTPLFIQKIMSFLPFGYSAYYTAQIILGRTTQVQNLNGLMILTSWTIIFSLLLIVLWKKGLKLYESVGR